MNTTPPAQLTIRITWLGIINYLGAILATGWMLYLLYVDNGLLYVLLALLLCAVVVLRIGASPILVIAAGVLHFHFAAAGIWLPLLALVPCKPSASAMRRKKITHRNPGNNTLFYRDNRVKYPILPARNKTGG